MNDKSSKHIPVLLQEVLQYLSPQKGETVIDATLGGGGHSMAILSQIGPTGRLLAIDADAEAVERFNAEKFKNATAVQGNFADIVEIVREREIESADVVLFDFGLSSDQLDSPERGFSFQAEGPLDMRMDQAKGMAAAEFINKTDEAELYRTFREYGEEINARGIARAVMIRRKSGREIKTTTELFELIKQALPGKFRFKAGDVARRVFQALRIKVNDELNAIPRGLSGAFELLGEGGRMGAISFHSLEDRPVKKYFAELSQGCICPPEFPVCVCGNVPKAKVLTPKPVVASRQEQEKNPRSKSAKFRAVEKI